MIVVALKALGGQLLLSYVAVCQQVSFLLSRLPVPNFACSHKPAHREYSLACTFLPFCRSTRIGHGPLILIV